MSESQKKLNYKLVWLGHESEPGVDVELVARIDLQEILNDSAVQTKLMNELMKSARLFSELDGDGHLCVELSFETSDSSYPTVRIRVVGQDGDDLVNLGGSPEEGRRRVGNYILDLKEMLKQAEKALAEIEESDHPKP